MTCMEPDLPERLKENDCKSRTRHGENGGKYEDKRFYEKRGGTDCNDDTFNGIFPACMYAEWGMQLPDVMVFDGNPCRAGALVFPGHPQGI